MNKKKLTIAEKSARQQIDRLIEENKNKAFHTEKVSGICLIIFLSIAIVSIIGSLFGFPDIFICIASTFVTASIITLVIGAVTKENHSRKTIAQCLVIADEFEIPYSYDHMRGYRFDTRIDNNSEQEEVK